MMQWQEIYPLLGEMMLYPRGEVASDAEAAIGILDEQRHAAAPRLRKHVAQIRSLENGSREELYSRTFDVMPACDPYVSSQMFGQESYQRGQLMAGFASAYRAVGFEWEPELPDHIAVILRFAPQFTREEWEDLVRHCLWEAVGKMASSLSPSGNPYGELLTAVRMIFETDVPDVLVRAPGTPAPDVPLSILTPNLMEEATRA